MVRRSLKAKIDIIFAGPAGRPVVADVAEKSYECREVAVYAPSWVGEIFLLYAIRAVPEGSIEDWNGILDPKVGASRREHVKSV